MTVAATLALGLAACQVPQATPHTAKSTSTGPAVALDQKPSAGTDAFSAEAPAPKPTPLAATPAVAHDIAPASLHLSGDPKELVGLDHVVVRRALGEPLHVRNEMPAQVWQYATGDCIVDLYLYDQDGVWTVTYVEARSHTAESAPTARCLKSLLERPTASAG
ncbi:MAG: hypothetical protein ABUL54_02055 [Dongia sp.]